MERIIGHEGEFQTIIQHRIAQGKIEIAVAIGLGGACIVREPMLIAGVQQECMPTVQIPVGRQDQTLPPSLESLYAIPRRFNILIIGFALG